MIRQVYHMPNGLTAVFDENRQQMPTYQGRTLQMLPLILRDADENTRYYMATGDETTREYMQAIVDQIAHSMTHPKFKGVKLGSLIESAGENIT